MTDWHCHILPNIDDGPATMEESVEMARSLRQAGYSTVYCTPHLIKGSFEVDNAAVRTSVAVLQARLNMENIDLELFPGREYYLDEFLLDYLKDPQPLGSTRYILIEVPNHMSLDRAKEAFYRIRSGGFIPMIAHPERCALFNQSKKQKDSRFKVLGSMLNAFNSKLFRPAVSVKTQNIKLNEESSLLDYLREIGCAFQGNLGSFAGYYGERPRRCAERLSAAGIYSHFGTDLHSARQALVVSNWRLAANF
jgi:protein-tyrosine phosphatase